MAGQLSHDPLLSVVVNTSVFLSLLYSEKSDLGSDYTSEVGLDKDKGPQKALKIPSGQ